MAFKQFYRKMGMSVANFQKAIERTDSTEHARHFLMTISEKVEKHIQTGSVFLVDGIFPASEDEEGAVEKRVWAVVLDPDDPAERVFCVEMKTYEWIFALPGFFYPDRLSELRVKRQPVPRWMK